MIEEVPEEGMTPYQILALHDHPRSKGKVRPNGLA
jgi:hypothetical protein